MDMSNRYFKDFEQVDTFHWIHCLTLYFNSLCVWRYFIEMNGVKNRNGITCTSLIEFKISFEYLELWGIQINRHFEIQEWYTLLIETRAPHGYRKPTMVFGPVLIIIINPDTVPVIPLFIPLWNQYSQNWIAYTEQKPTQATTYLNKFYDLFAVHYRNKKLMAEWRKICLIPTSNSSSRYSV